MTQTQTQYRIIPRVAVYDAMFEQPVKKEAILFLPDLPASYGMVSCYARDGEHSEASIEFYNNGTAKPSPLCLELAKWYLKNKCEPPDNAVIRQRWQRRRVEER